MASFQDKLVVISGAASGIGRATAKLLASRGALLSLSDINAAGLEAVRAEISDLTPAASITTAVVDVRSQDAVDAWIRDAVAHFGGRKIAAAANLAGVTGSPTAGRDVSDAEFGFVWDVNVRGILNCLRAELPHLEEDSGGRGGGAIVNASSLSGQVGLPGFLPYVASKHAVIGIIRTVAKEEGGRGIRVNAIAPWVISLPYRLSTVIH